MGDGLMEMAEELSFNGGLRGLKSLDDLREIARNIRSRFHGAEQGGEEGVPG